jgi:hypothetical protein
VKLCKHELACLERNFADFSELCDSSRKVLACHNDEVTSVDFGALNASSELQLRGQFFSSPCSDLYFQSAGKTPPKLLKHTQ